MQISSSARKVAKDLITRGSFLTGHRAPLRAIRSIDIEPVAACNLRCHFCQVPGWDRAKTTRPMKLDLFESVLAQLPGLKTIKLQGMGEPFLNRSLVDMIQLSTDRGILSLIHSNGTIMSDELGRRVHEAGLTRLSFSFDGSTKETYEAARIRAKFERVKANIALFCDLKRSMNSATATDMSYLITNEEMLYEVPDYVRMAAELGVDGVYLRRKLKVWDAPGEDGSYAFDTIFLDHHPDYSAIVEEAHEIAKEKQLDFKITEETDFTKDSPCPWPWTQLYVSTEGKVVPCCAIAVPETMCMGDLTQESMADIWNNEQYRELRRQIADNEPSDLCKACYKNCGSKT